MTSLLDHGFLRYVDHMGTDADIVAAARLSYQKGTRPVQKDTALLRYLWRKEHFSPFEMAEVKLHIKMPIFVARQWVRHRTGSMNEMSGRYSEMPADFYVPDVARMGTQSKTNKQGTGDLLDVETATSIQEEMYDLSNTDFACYQSWISEGVDLSRELARTQLPLSTYTEFVWKQDLRNLLHLTRLRIDPHAQYEVRVYAEALADVIKELFPETWRAFEDYTLHAVTFSRMEKKLLLELLDLQGFTTPARPEDMTQREYDEFWAKLKSF